MTVDAPGPPPVVLIHGLWMTPQSWDGWAGRFRARGHVVHTPAWPGMDRPVAALREDPSPMAGLGFAQIAAHLEGIVRGLEAPPIIMGHSFGGAFTQVLLDRGLGLAGVAIDPAPLKGIYALPISALRASLPVLGRPGNRKRAVGLTPEQFHYAFTNTMTAEESRAVWEREHIPAPGRPLFEAATANFNPKAPTKVDFARERAPLLVYGGEQDHIVPRAITRETVKRQRRSPSITAYKEWPGRTHYLVGQPGWEELADLALDWALAPRELDERV